jgi:hypothetical protein
LSRADLEFVMMHTRHLALERTGWSRVPFILPRPSGNAKAFFFATN